MKDQFIRKLTIQISEQEAGTIKEFLLSWNIEVYAKEKNEYQYIGQEEVFPAGSIYVPVADYDEARRLMIQEGYEDILCNEEPTKGTDTELERAEKAFYRKRKLEWIGWLIVVLVVLLYRLLRG